VLRLLDVGGVQLRQQIRHNPSLGGIVRCRSKLAVEVVDAGGQLRPRLRLHARVHAEVVARQGHFDIPQGGVSFGAERIAGCVRRAGDVGRGHAEHTAQVFEDVAAVEGFFAALDLAEVAIGDAREGASFSEGQPSPGTNLADAAADISFHERTSFAELTSPRAPGSYPGAFLCEEVQSQVTRPLTE
jgi:hypothetical protein